MTSFFITLFCFLISFTLHILVHKYYRVHIARVVAAYAIGALLLYGFGGMGYISLPWSSGFLYVLLACTAILFYIAVSLGTEIPTSIILASFQRKKRQSFDDVVRLFTDHGLIFIRVDDLVQSKLIEHRGGQLKITGKGKVIWYAMKLYTWVFYRALTE